MEPTEPSSCLCDKDHGPAHPNPGRPRAGADLSLTESHRLRRPRGRRHPGGFVMTPPIARADALRGRASRRRGWISLHDSTRKAAPRGASGLHHGPINADPPPRRRTGTPTVLGLFRPTNHRPSNLEIVVPNVRTNGESATSNLCFASLAIRTTDKARRSCSGWHLLRRISLAINRQTIACNHECYRLSVWRSLEWGRWRQQQDGTQSCGAILGRSPMIAGAGHGCRVFRTNCHAPLGHPTP